MLVCIKQGKQVVSSQKLWAFVIEDHGIA